MNELKKDTNRVILTVDKGTCLAVMDKEEYINKAQDLLKEETYRIIPEHPTNKQKNKLIQLLKKIKSEGGINEENYKKMYLLVHAYQNVMGCQKSIKLEFH